MDASICRIAPPVLPWTRDGAEVKGVGRDSDINCLGLPRFGRICPVGGLAEWEVANAAQAEREKFQFPIGKKFASWPAG